MKIGILTYHYAYNFGAFLQAFALQEHLKAEGHQVEFINYENDYVNLAYKLFRFKIYNKRRPLQSLRRFLSEVGRVFRFPKFRKCVFNYLQIGIKIQTKDIYDITDYDCIVIGSDQLWNKKITNGFDPFYCAQFKKGKGQKIIGYAISMNKPQLDEDESIELRQVLSHFDYMSVREATSVNLLQPLTTKEVNLVIDPTFLLKKEVWMSNILHSKEKGYICCYPVLNQKEVKKRAKEIAKRLNKKLIILEPIAESIVLSGCKKVNTPFEFVSYIANSDLVITSSFHGTAFSLILNKDFFVLGDDSANVRMKCFLTNLNLENRIIPLDRDIDITDHIDYEIVNIELDKMIVVSKKFLKDSLKN